MCGCRLVTSGFFNHHDDSSTNLAVAKVAMAATYATVVRKTSYLCGYLHRTRFHLAIWPNRPFLIETLSLASPTWSASPLLLLHAPS